jgi:hypothetical protein
MSLFAALFHRIADAVLGPVGRAAIIATDADAMLVAVPRLAVGG